MGGYRDNDKKNPFEKQMEEINEWQKNSSIESIFENAVTILISVILITGGTLRLVRRK